jgi:hypothetical protein
MISNDTDLYEDLRRYSVRTPAGQDTYVIMLTLSKTHGRTITFEAIRNKSTRSNIQIKQAIREVERAGLCIIDGDEITVIV